MKKKHAPNCTYVTETDPVPMCSCGADSPRPAEELLTRWMASPLPCMATVIRFSSFAFHHRESVAEHCFYVMFLSWVLAQHIQEMNNEPMCCGEDTGVAIDYTKLLEKGLFHDLDESITGDIIRPFKYSSEDLRRELTLASVAAVEDQFASMPGGGPTTMLTWQSAKDDSIEGRIVDFADVWSVWLYLRREVDMGNRIAERKIALVAQRVDETKWHELVQPYADAMAFLMRRGV